LEERVGVEGCEAFYVAAVVVVEALEGVSAGGCVDYHDLGLHGDEQGYSVDVGGDFGFDVEDAGEFGVGGAELA
jgi:hypothetical protein